MMNGVQRRLAALVATGMVAVGGFASALAQAGTPLPEDAARTTYPLTVTNCGQEITVEAAPKRIVTGTQQAAETLIHLGVTDRIVGTAYEVDAIPEEIAADYATIPKLVEQGELIAHEPLLEAQPDFVFSTLGGDFTAERGGTREELTDLGVLTYISEFDCTMHSGVESPDFDLLFQQYRDLGRILDVADTAEEVIADQQNIVDEALAARGDGAESLTVLWFYSDFEGTPWVAGAGGLPQHVSDLVGVENVYADASESWIETSYDEIAARNPDVIVVADLSRGYVNDTAAEKIDLLISDPLTRELAAVVNDHLITMPGSYMDPSFGSVQMVPALVEGLAEFD
jgi:iron complex transport system substrate-binding protein